MFLDAWLKLGILGLIIPFASLLGLPLFGFLLFRAIKTCRKLWRENDLEQFWLTVILVILVAALFSPIAVLVGLLLGARSDAA